MVTNLFCRHLLLIKEDRAMTYSFDLRISLKGDGLCTFSLIWDQGQRDIFASQTFTPQLRRDYQVWQKAYLRYYSLPNDENISRSGGLSISTGDPSSIVRNKEEAFLSTFLDWLGSGDIRLIERQLETALLEIKQLEDQKLVETSHINIYLACDERFLRPLPWEFWVKSLIPKKFSENSIRLIRTVKDNSSQLAEVPSKTLSRKPRVLAILGIDPNLSINKDWHIIKSLRPICEIEQATFSPDAESHHIIQQILAKITDDRGWDILFFAGHSDDTTSFSGSFQLTSKVSLSTRDIADHLETARGYGLRLAIFNSCCGLAIAQSLTRIGIQSVVMREKIHSDVAIVFLEQLCLQLKQAKDIHTCLLNTCKFLKENENIKFPSAHLIPSFFSPPRQLPYYFERRSWQEQIKILRPTKREIIFSGLVLFLSFLGVDQGIITEARVASQAIYRDFTNQYPALNETPIHVIAVDQEYINLFPDNHTGNISHDLIASIIDQISDYANPKILGISYILYNQNQKSQALLSSINNLHDKHDSWLVMTNDAKESLRSYDSLQALPMNFQGDSYFRYWNVDTPDDQDQENLCPFAYNLALLHTLKQDDMFFRPLEFKQEIQKENQRLIEQNSGRNFCNSFLDFIKKNINSPNESETSNFIVRNQSKLGWLSIIDFSIPPKAVYERTVVSGPESLSLRNNSETIFIIGSGTYRDAEDRYVAPLAIEYWWCQSSNFKKYKDENCQFGSRPFSSAETYAYMAAQLLQHKQVRVMPNYWMLALSILLSKTLILGLESYQFSQKKKMLPYIYLGILGYIALSLQLYISVSILFPILFPVSLFAYYLKPIFKRASQ